MHWGSRQQFWTWWLFKSGRGWRGAVSKGPMGAFSHLLFRLCDHLFCKHPSSTFCHNQSNQTRFASIAVCCSRSHSSFLVGGVSSLINSQHLGLAAPIRFHKPHLLICVSFLFTLTSCSASCAERKRLGWQQLLSQPGWVFFFCAAWAKVSFL